MKGSDHIVMLVILTTTIASCDQAPKIFQEDIVGKWSCEYSSKDGAITGEGKLVHRANGGFDLSNQGKLTLEEYGETLNWLYKSNGTFQLRKNKLTHSSESVDVTMLPATGPIADNPEGLKKLQDILLEGLTEEDEPNHFWRINSLSEARFSMIDWQDHMHGICTREG